MRPEPKPAHPLAEEHAQRARENRRHASEIALREAAKDWAIAFRAPVMTDHDNECRKADRALQRAAVRFAEQHPEMLR